MQPCPRPRFPPTTSSKPAFRPMHRLTESIIDHAAITLVIAHPDDECMFFYPTISRAKRLHIICLSNGGYDGLGEQREKELQRAARRCRARLRRLGHLQRLPLRAVQGG